MTDIATVNNAPGLFGIGLDWAIENFALQNDDGLTTSVINSLFWDRVAEADDELPDNSGDRRGCWTDEALDGGAPDKAGSRLWLLSRAKATPQTAAQAQFYALESLQWMIDDGVADKVDATAVWLAEDQLKLTIVIIRTVNGSAVNHRWDFVWNPSTGQFNQV